MDYGQDRSPGARSESGEVGERMSKARIRWPAVAMVALVVGAVAAQTPAAPAAPAAAPRRKPRRPSRVAPRCLPRRT